MPTTAAATTTQATTATPIEAKAKMEGPSIKFHLSSVSYSCILTALKQHLTTWRQKLTSTKGSSIRKKQKSTTPPNKAEHQRSQPEEGTQSHCHHHSGKWFRRSTRKEYYSSETTTTSSTATSCEQRTSVYCKAKLLHIPTTSSSTSDSTLKQFTTSTIGGGGDRKGPRRRYGRKVEIVAKLLSLNLIQSDVLTSSATSTDDHCPDRRGSADSGCLSIDTIDSILTSKSHSLGHSNQDFVETVERSVTSSGTNTISTTTADKMTITDLTFLEIRDENPELDSEIRSILTTRAQEGATISEIRDDYRKLTGLVFPVYECITDFLLSIPYVSAYCNENGTRIFNIRPMDKTKHIHNMVVSQKPTQEHVPRSYNNNHRPYYRERQRNSNYYPNNWRHNSFRNRKQQEEIQYCQQQQQQQQPQPHRIEDPYAAGDQPNPPAVGCNDKNFIIESTEDFIEHNCCYDDNCNYLLKRICNQENIVDAIPNPISLQTIAPPTMYTWDEQHQPAISEKNPPLPSVQDLNNLNDNATCYDNNINHLNNIFHKRNLMNNGVPRQRRSLNAPPPKDPILQPRVSTSPTVKSSSTNDTMFTDTDYEAHLLDFLLLGDDFLLFMARMELKCKFKKNQKVLQSGLCVSGQTINAAIRRISNLDASGRSVIVNIGSVNILQCRQLIQIEHEYRELIKTMIKKGIKPILTTLAPLANYSHNYELKITLERFNKFIKREAKRMDLVVIDIWKCLMNEKGQVLFDCYQSEPRFVTGARESYLFWNKIGRQRVLQMIESNLEY